MIRVYNVDNYAKSFYFVICMFFENEGGDNKRSFPPKPGPIPPPTPQQ